MKIKFERECCDKNQDLLVYQGLETPSERNLFFCKYCGQLWKNIKYADEAGDTDTKLIAVYPPRGVGYG